MRGLWPKRLWTLSTLPQRVVLQPELSDARQRPWKPCEKDEDRPRFFHFTWENSLKTSLWSRILELFPVSRRQSICFCKEIGLAGRPRHGLQGVAVGARRRAALA